MDTERVYFSYLLRLWQHENSGNRVWLASLESPLTGERRGFSDLEALFDFLRTQCLHMHTGEIAPNPGELKEAENDKEQ